MDGELEKTAQIDEEVELRIQNSPRSLPQFLQISLTALVTIYIY
jgi:hypothetical protein